MTISDLVSRLTALVSSKNRTMGVESSAQVKLGKHFDDDGEVFDSFDIIRKDGNVIAYSHQTNGSVKDANH